MSGHDTSKSRLHEPYQLAATPRLGEWPIGPSIVPSWPFLRAEPTQNWTLLCPIILWVIEPKSSLLDLMDQQLPRCWAGIHLTSKLEWYSKTCRIQYNLVYRSRIWLCHWRLVPGRFLLAIIRVMSTSQSQPQPQILYTSAWKIIRALMVKKSTTDRTSDSN